MTSRNIPRRALAIAVVGVLTTVAFGWRVSEQARETWWPSGAHAAVGPGEDFGGIQVELDGIEPAGQVVDWDGPWTPPAGFRAWRVSLAVTTRQSDFSSVEVLVEDTQGRQFAAGENVPFDPEGYEWSLAVTVPESGDDPIPEVQHLLVLLPADAEPAAVRIDALWVMRPEYIRLEVE
ncbi:hypothetical protein [Ruania alba]|uniref:DUF4352 domain-containing protein n=1 Tax=Ruania alba TaxID=648782 RepID=A0A1H5MJS7_9MICO|nr:hypothetical protein [Ruania alba]SEE89645.1 hypothetical protein SAMN04488554_3450 [Ruania alba]